MISLPLWMVRHARHKLLHHVRQPKGRVLGPHARKPPGALLELRVHRAGVLGAQRQELEAVLLEASNFLCFSCAALFVTANSVLEVLLPEVGLWMCTSPSTNSSPMQVAHVVRGSVWTTAAAAVSTQPCTRRRRSAIGRWLAGRTAAPPTAAAR